MPIVKFIKENKEIEVSDGANLRKVALSAGVNLYQGINGFGAGANKVLNCYGWGTCGTCRVNIGDHRGDEERGAGSEEVLISIYIKPS